MPSTPRSDRSNAAVCEVERDQVSSDLAVQALRRLRPGAAQQRHGELRHAVLVRGRLAEDVVVAGEQAQNYALSGFGVLEAADLDGQSVGPAPDGRREIGTDQGLDGVGAGVRRAVASGGEQKVDARLVEDIGQRQHGVSELIGLPFRDRRGAFPDDLAVIGLALERVPLHRLTESILARKRDHVPLSHAQQLQLDGRQVMLASDRRGA